MKKDIFGFAAKTFILAVAAVIVIGGHNLKKQGNLDVARQPVAVHAVDRSA